MVAVTAFVGKSPRAGRAALFGFRWGLGHALVVLAVGGALAWTGVSVPSSLETWAGLAVGVMLVVLGFWAMRASRRLHVHRPEDHGGHAHLHAHAPERHPHSHTQEHAAGHEHSHDELRRSHAHEQTTGTRSLDTGTSRLWWARYMAWPGQLPSWL